MATLLLFGTMQQNPARPHLSGIRLLRVVNVSLATIFGLLMPFVCWGVEATPGHSHARAHFVFMQPQVIKFASHNLEHIVAAAAALPGGIEVELCTAPSAADSTSAATPVTQSTPSILAVFLLLTTLTTTQVLPRRSDSGGFTHSAAALRGISPPLAIITPPPRHV